MDERIKLLEHFVILQNDLSILIYQCETSQGKKSFYGILSFIDVNAV